MNAPSPVRSAADARAAPLVLREDAGDVAIVTLNRPDARNSLSEAMLSALGATFAGISGERAVRAVVLTAKGPAFSAGHDLKELTAHRADADRGRAFFQRVMESCSSVMQQIVRLPQPVIAAVQGTATAAGCQLVATCDLALASAEAKFATPGVNIGLFCSTPMVALTRNVAPKHAMEMLLTGEMVSAEEAWRIGLVNRVCEPGEHLEAALALAHEVKEANPVTVRYQKRALREAADRDLRGALAVSLELQEDVKRALGDDFGAAVFAARKQQASVAAETSS